jgi:chloride channel 3/4/5
MTIYLSASHHTTSKDSTFLLPPTSSPVAKQAKNPEGQTMPIDERVPLLASSSSMSGGDEQFERKVLEVEPPRKVMYYAAGSGIPEIKTILSGESGTRAVAITRERMCGHGILTVEQAS